MDSLKTVIDTAKQVIDTATASTTVDSLKSVADTLAAHATVTDTIVKTVTDTVTAMATSAEGHSFFSLLGGLVNSMSHTEAKFDNPMIPFKE